MFSKGTFAVGTFAVGTWCVADVGGGSGLEIKIKYNEYGLIHPPFSVGDDLAMKVWVSNTEKLDAYLRITEVGEQSAGIITYTVDVLRGSIGTFPAGTAIVNYGQDGDGLLKLTSDEPEAPFIQAATRASDPWDLTEHLRLGRIENVLGLGAGAIYASGEPRDTVQWGLAVAADLHDASQPHAILTNHRFSLHGVAQTWIDSSGAVRGSVNPDALDTDHLFWLGKDVNEKYVWVYGDGAMGISPAVFLGMEGDMFFSLQDGILLLGPYTGMDVSGWTSSRGHIAEISGAFRQVAGRWQMTKALPVLRDLTNLITNPVFGVDLAGWSTFNGQAERVTTRPRHGDACCQLTAGVNTNPYIYCGSIVSSPTQGQSYALSAELRMPHGSSATLGRVYIRERGGVASNASAYGEVRLTTEWQRVSVAHTVQQADRTDLDVWVRIYGPEYATGYIDGVNLTASDYLAWHIDGTLQGCAWSGVAHASTSSVTSKTIVSLDDHVGALNGKDQLTIRAICQVPRAWNSGIAWTYVMDASDAVDSYTERFAIGYNPATRRWEIYCQHQMIMRSEEGAHRFRACDWMDLVVTMDFVADEYHLYMNGQPLASNAQLGLHALDVDYWKLGANYDGGILPSGTVIQEFAVLGSILSQQQVAGLFTQQRPMVDTGGSEGPLLSILDGRIKIASATSGQRVEIDSGATRVYDPNGNLAVQLDEDGLALMAATTGFTDLNGLRIVDPSEGTPNLFYIWGNMTAGAFNSDIASYGMEDGTMTLRIFGDDGYSSQMELTSSIGETLEAGVELFVDDSDDSEIVNVWPELGLNSRTYRLRRNGTHIEWFNGVSWNQLD